ncbi:pyridoxamine 5'-phosphate oxidase family protein [Microbacterium sp. ASV49]|uniref:Pyridoxamine 5'-phosphate oxidase family protein n=1 Tax=Microbacterium candidum TaxID=3041922 RepID=A0ABT7N3N5_9MICO|nr:pyridoxamine 5'-phosphate oxidase family protein [Microbacterium sp. ASV49]MDL9981286.1 pyridoxamine 5'-phosphate oxidase family protein [Microbacterium sp. ASV49]
MTGLLNPDVDVDAKALRMLENDLLAWFVTTARDGTPRAVPVWFLWHDGRVIVMSEPQTGKVAAVRRGAPVLMHLQAGGPFGDDVVILHGTAEIDARSTAEWLAEHHDAYLGKYAEAIDDYGVPLDDIAVKFSTIIVFSPGRIQAW